jgi:hypothetical protein
VALDREFKIGACHTLAVVGHPDHPPASAVCEYINAMSASVERILDQFLHDARRPLDHLAGCDAIDDGLG